MVLWGSAVRGASGRIILGSLVAATLAGLSSAPTHAAGANDTFSLQVSPSPMVQTVKPGVESSTPLQIQNKGTGTEDLKIEVRRFQYNEKTGQISIDDIADPNLSQWISVPQSKFSLSPGQVFTENVSFDFPTNSGFSYSFVFVISRQNQPQATGGGRLLEGSIGDFGLINIDRPGATRGFEVASIKASAGVYEYAPATIEMTLKNTGNTVVQPFGSIFIGRGSGGDAIDTIELNDTGGYILPGTSRTVDAVWNDGFPSTQTELLSDGTKKSHTVWDFTKLSKFRIGSYTARVVAVYNNGTYDVPVNAEVSFWIFPWKIIVGFILFLAVVGFGGYMFVKSIFRKVNPKKPGFRK